MAWLFGAFFVRLGMPIFFATLAFHLHLSWTAQFLFCTFLLISAAIAGKLVGCGLGAAAFGHNRRENAIIGFGMNGRGAVETVGGKCLPAWRAGQVLRTLGPGGKESGLNAPPTDWQSS